MDTDANAEVESSDSEDDAVEEGKSNKQQADDDDEPEEVANTDPVVDPRALKPFTGDSLPYDVSSKVNNDDAHNESFQVYLGMQAIEEISRTNIAIVEILALSKSHLVTK